jgi:hypothetical protein
VQEPRTEREGFATVRRILLDSFAQLLSDWRGFLPVGVDASAAPMSPRGPVQSAPATSAEAPTISKDEYLSTFQKDNLVRKGQDLF